MRSAPRGADLLVPRQLFDGHRRGPSHRQAPAEGVPEDVQLSGLLEPRPALQAPDPLRQQHLSDLAFDLLAPEHTRSAEVAVLRQRRGEPLGEDDLPPSPATLSIVLRTQSTLFTVFGLRSASSAFSFCTSESWISSSRRLAHLGFK